MLVPYIKIRQKQEEFFIIKFSALQLKDKLNFHFRESNPTDINGFEDYNSYINKIRKKGIEINADAEGIQRRIQLDRINKIKDYLENQYDSFFPTSVLLSADVSNHDLFITEYLENDYFKDIGHMNIPDDVFFQVVDGQHRLAGLFISDIHVQNDFELVAVVLFNATKQTCAKLFRDINGNQKTVNKSVINDLLDTIDANDESTIRNRNLHLICKKFQTDENSPLFQHIKMLGVGNGAISQAFFIQYLNDALKKIGYTNEFSPQDTFNSLFFYFTAFQNVFQNYWPVLSNKLIKSNEPLPIEFIQYYDSLSDVYDYSDIRKFYSDYILKHKKSQLLKTNGFGAIMLLFPSVYKKVQQQNYVSYYSIISKLYGEIDWCNDEILSQGTGKKTQQKLFEKLIFTLSIYE